MSSTNSHFVSNPAFTVARLRALLVLGMLAAAGLWYLFWFNPREEARRLARQYDAGAAASLRAHDEEGAEAGWLAALGADPQDESAYYKLGQYYAAHGETEVSSTCYVRLLQINPKYPHVYCELAEATRAYGSEKDAKAYAERELRLDPNCVRATELLCAIDQHAGNLKDAERLGARAFRLAPHSEEAVCRYAETYLDEEPNKAIQILSHAQPSMRNSAQVAFDLGWAYAHTAMDPHTAALALEELRLAERLKPAGRGIHTELCRFLLDQGQVKDALEEGRRAVIIDQYNPNSYFQYSLALKRDGRQVDAAEMMRRFQVLDRARSRQIELERRYTAHPGDPRIAHQLAEADALIGKFNDAEIVMEIALYAHPRDPGVLKDFSALMKVGATP